MRSIEAILRGILKAIVAVPMAPLGLLSGLLNSASQSQSMPQPARRAAAAVSDAAAAKMVRKYAAAVSRDRPLYDLSRLPKRYREYAESLSKEDAARVARLSDEQVVAEVSKGRPAKTASDGDARPQPRPSAIPPDVRRHIRERGRERRYDRRADTHGPLPAPRLDPCP